MKIEKKSAKKTLIIASMVIIAMTVGDSYFNEAQATSTWGSCPGVPFDKEMHTPISPSNCYGLGDTCKSCVK